MLKQLACAALTSCLGLLALQACDPAESARTTTAHGEYEIITRYPPATRVVALGDIHGDVEAMREALQLAGVIDELDHWTGGDTVVVQTGDLLDRGGDEQAIIDLLEQLEGEARDAGGALHVLNGNHELMNVALDFRYVTEAGLLDFEDAPGVDPNDPKVLHLAPELRARASAFMPGGSYAMKLAEHPVVVMVGDTVFAHGGVHPNHADDIDAINEQVAAWLRGEDDEGEWVVEDDRSPVWSRHYSDDPSNHDCGLLDDALDTLGATRMVVGHTVRPQISSECDDKVWLVDVGMAAHYGGTPQVLELIDGETYVLSY
jgi:hypothetical protein